MHITDPARGLSQQEVRESWTREGDNTLSPGKGRSFFRQLLDNLGDPIIKVLLAALAINVLFLFRGEGWFETAGIAAAAFAASLISTLSEHSSERAFRRLQEQAGRSFCRVRRDGLLREIAAGELAVGDIVLLQAGEGVPADGVLVGGSLSCDQSALSGESREVKKRPGSPQESGRWETGSRHLLFRGSTVAQGEGFMQVLRVGDKTLLGSMAQSLQEEPPASPLKARLEVLARRMSRLGYGAAALVAGADLFYRIVMENGFVPSLILAELSHFPTVMERLLHAATLAIGVVIVAVPEGLPMMITVVLSRSMLRMQKDQVMVRRLTGIETAGSLSLLFTDKTGTLTRGQLRVQGLLLGDGSVLSPREAPKSGPLWQAVRECCLLNTSAQWSGKTALGGNATDRALLELAGREPVQAAVLRRKPFDSEKKYALAAVEGGAYPIYLTGAPEVLLPQCQNYLSPLEGGALDREALEQAWRAEAARGSRVVALCAGEKDGDAPILLALALIRDPLRQEAPGAVRQLQGAGIQVVMVTGDSPETARAIAAGAGLLRGGGEVLTSRELNELTDRQVQELLPRLRVVARALPTDKSRLVRVAQQMGRVVGMTGDGINDAPALRLADVGFAMGSGTRVAKEAGDILILDDNISSIARAVLYGRTIFRSIQRFLVFQLTMNCTAVLVSVLGPFLGVETPVTVIQMLWINMIMDTLAGLAFAGEPPRARYMERPPLPRDAPVLTRAMAGQIAGLSLYLTALCAAFLRVPMVRALFSGAGGDFLTAFFALFVFSGLAAAFCARCEGPNLLAGLGRNHSFLPVMGAAGCVQLALLRWGGTVFRTVPLSPEMLLRVGLLSLSVIPADTARKLLFRGKK